MMLVPIPWRAMLHALALALAVHAGLDAATGRFELPRRAVPGLAPVRIVFLDASGAPLLERVGFELAVTGRARFAAAARSGRLLAGGGTPFIGAESDTGLFEIDVDLPGADAIEFLFQETTRVLDGPIVQTIFEDPADGPPPRWLSSTLGASPAAWSRVDVDSGDPRGRTGTWWSGPPVPSADSALVSVPIAVPSRGSTFLTLRHRYGLEGGECPPGGPARHAGLVQIESSLGGWIPLAPAGGYPDPVDGRCDGPFDGLTAFGGTTGGQFIETAFDAKPLAGRRARIRLRLAAGCEDCAPAEGWFIDSARLETTLLSVDVLDAAGDPDEDGVPSGTEISRGSDPRAPDTDGDGLPDGVEDLGGVFEGPGRTGTDPTSPDTDGAGISDGVEVELGTDPNDPLEEPAERTLPAAVPLGPGGSWVIGLDGTAGSSGADSLREVFSGAGGFRLSAGPSAFPTGRRAFDEDGTGDRLALEPARTGPFLVTRRIAGSRDRRAIRYLETFENVSSRREEAIVQIECEFAQKPWAEVESTESGDALWTVEDGHVHFNDRDPGDGMPYVLWLHSGPGARLALEAGGMEEGRARVTARLVLEPGEKKSFLHLAALSDTLDLSREAARALIEEIGAGGRVPRGADAHIVNFAIDRDGDGLPAWFEAAAGLDPDDAADARADPDGDGLTNLEEYAAGSDPRSPDTDGDGLLDGQEAKDLGTDPRSPDSDGDGIGDASDPFPAAAVIADIEVPRHAFQGSAAPVVVALDEGGAPPARPVRFRLASEGPESAFQGPVEGGEILEGLGTSSVLVEVRGGPLGLFLAAPGPGVRSIRLDDSERQGVVVLPRIEEDFESSDGSFTAGGDRGAWEWGAPAGAPGAASGSKVWGVGLSGRYPSSASARLTSPEHVLDSAGAPRLELSMFLEAEEDYDEATIWVVERGREPALLAGPLPDTGPGYERVSFDLARYRGKAVRIEFAFEADASIELRGWYLDDFVLDGIEAGAAVEFIDPAGDLDGDGVDNGTEAARGTDIDSRDTDGDGLDDGVETGTGVLVDERDTGTDPAAADTDSGGERDGAEVSRGSDPHDPADDEVPVTFDEPGTGVPLVDGAGNEWEGNPFGAGIIESPEMALFLDVLLTAGNDAFFAFEGKLTQGGRTLVLESTLGFLGPPHARKLFASREAPLLRWLDVFENPSAAAATSSFRWESLIFGESPAEVVETSSGDRIIDAADTSYILEFEGGGKKLYLGRVVRGEGAGHAARSVTAVTPFISESHALGLPAGGRAAFLRFASLAASLDEVRESLALAARLDPRAIDGLSEEDLSLVVNFHIDTDGDGLPDSYEIANGLDPRDPADAAGDEDLDGLDALEERALGTDPARADTDGDGLLDGEEKRRGTDPLLEDTDGDGLNDGADLLPLHRILVRVPVESAAIAGEETRWRLRLELADRTPLADAGIGDEGFLVSVRFDPPIEVVRVAAGERTGERDGAHLFRPAGGRLVLDLRPAAEGPIVVTVRDGGTSGLPAAGSFIRVAAADSDPDRDGLSSAFEVDRGSDPFSPDSDADGIADRFETGSGAVSPPLDIGTFPWTPDSDGGGAKDLDEILAGLDPLDPADDLVERPLPIDLRGAAGAWSVLPSWALTGSILGSTFDNAGTLRLNGRPLPPAVAAAEAAGGGTVRLGPAAAAGLEVSRTVHAHAVTRFVRLVDVFRNTGGSAVEARVEIGFDAAGDAASIAATSSRDSVLDARDGWVILRDGNLHLLHVFFGGPGFREVEVVSPDILRMVFVFEVPPGETRSLVHFAGTGSLGALHGLARTIVLLEGGALDGMSAEVAGGIVNLPRLQPVVWDRLPRAAVAPGDLLVIAGELFSGGLEARIGGTPCERFALLPDRLVVRVPAGPPGPSSLEVAFPGSGVIFQEPLEVGTGAGRFRRGDADGSGIVDLSDAVMLLDHLFRGGEAPACADAADSDDSGALDLTDSVHLLRLLFQGIGQMPYPGGIVPGVDPAPDLLDCP
jgi:hypothetical protein